MHDEDATHGEGLDKDLILIRRQMERRRALRLLGTAAGFVALGAAGKVLAPARALAAPARCTADAPEIPGPFPADGTNHAQGETSDVLTESGVVRKDIQRSFLSTRTRARGVEVQLDLTLVDTKAGCVTESGFAVYLWHCDRDGLYSLYTAPDESYLRGVQVSDESGRVSFKTIFPGCYPGRWPHMHIEIFTSLDEATNGRNSILTTQLAMPADICGDIYDNAKGYGKSKGYFANVTIGGDICFGDDTPRQLAAMTPNFKGSVTDGYAANAMVGVRV